jgi:large subunit ribosomal protein L10Ae
MFFQCATVDCSLHLISHLRINRLANDEDMQEKINELRATIKFQLKKVMCLNVAIGNVEMDKQEIIVNTQLAANFLASLLKKQWQNIGQMYIKSTMGPSFQIYF